MKSITMWYADDGASFYSEEKCRKYEEEQMIKAAKLSVTLLDEMGREIPFSLNNYDEAKYLCIKNQEAAVQLDNFLRPRNYVLPWSRTHEEPRAGVWFWVDHSKWADINNECNLWKRRLEIATKAIKE